MKNKKNSYDFDISTPLKELSEKQLMFFIITLALMTFLFYCIGKDIGLAIYNLTH